MIKHKLRHKTTIWENQFGFMLGRSTMKAISLLRSLMEKYGEACKDLHMVFIDLEKTYYRVAKELCGGF